MLPRGDRMWQEICLRPARKGGACTRKIVYCQGFWSALPWQLRTTALSRIAPSTWELGNASACLSFVALYSLAMAAGLWVADRYHLFSVFARFLAFVLHPHIGVAGCLIFRLKYIRQLAGLFDA